MTKKIANDVTIVMRTYNRPLMLARALKSVMQQTYPHWQLALINNGGSVDDVMTIVNGSGIDKQKIHVIHNTTPKTFGRELNQGFEALPAEYAAVHDDDDTWHPEYLEKSVDYLKNKKQNDHTAGVVCYTRLIKEKIEGNKIIEIDSSGEYNKSVSLLFKAKKEDAFGNESIRTLGLGAIRLLDMLRWTLFTPTSFVYEQRVYNEIGRYPEDIIATEDFAFVTKFLSHYDIEVIPEYLANYHHRMFQECDDNYKNITIKKSDMVFKLDHNTSSRRLADDLATGHIGLGVLNEFAKQFEFIVEKNDEILSLLRKIETKLENKN